MLKKNQGIVFYIQYDPLLKKILIYDKKPEIIQVVVSRGGGILDHLFSFQNLYFSNFPQWVFVTFIIRKKPPVNVEKKKIFPYSTLHQKEPPFSEFVGKKWFASGLVWFANYHNVHMSFGSSSFFHTVGRAHCRCQHGHEFQHGPSAAQAQLADTDLFHFIL